MSNALAHMSNALAHMSNSLAHMSNALAHIRCLTLMSTALAHINESCHTHEWVKSNACLTHWHISDFEEGTLSKKEARNVLRSRPDLDSASLDALFK